MNRFLKYWRLQEKGKQYRAKIVAYADDFVILSRGYAEQARDADGGWLAELLPPWHGGRGVSSSESLRL
jgi:hypothetical protein